MKRSFAFIGSINLTYRFAFIGFPGNREWWLVQILGGKLRGIHGYQGDPTKAHVADGTILPTILPTFG